MPETSMPEKEAFIYHCGFAWQIRTKAGSFAEINELRASFEAHVT